MRLTTLAAVLSFVLAVFLSPVVHAEDVTVPAVETWEQMPVPFPPNGREAAFIQPQWHKDPQGKNFEGMTIYMKHPDGSEILVAKSWNFWDPDGSGAFRKYNKVRVALKGEDGKWLVGDEGEMFSMSWQWRADNTAASVTMRFVGSHANTPVTFKFQ